MEEFVWYGFIDHVPIGVANLLLKPMGVEIAAPAWRRSGLPAGLIAGIRSWSRFPELVLSPYRSGRDDTKIASDGGAANPRHLDPLAEATDSQDLLGLADGEGNRDQLRLAGQ
jgi:hypothetical protein